MLLAFVATARGATGFVEFRFREPQPVSYRIEVPAGARIAAMLQPELPARRADDAAQTVDLTSRVALRLIEGTDVNTLVAGTKLVVDRVLAPQWFILQAPDAWTAAREAERLAALPEVLAAHPVRRFPMRTSGPYAARFNDRFIPNQWNLENRDASGAQPGVDLNVRAAWPFSRGEGVVVAIADNGVDLAHPDFLVPAAGQPHFNFENQTTNGTPVLSGDNHGTAVAGYAVAQGNNGIGISGVAPSAGLAGWKMLNATEEAIGVMFQFQSNSVAVQNHSWLLSGSGLAEVSELAANGLSNALTFGREGRGVIMLRASGNGRTIAANANDQAYTADPRVITVAGVRITGRVASYSTPGATVLVAAPVGDTGYDAPPTTDRTGSTFGYNRFPLFFLDDSADYAFNANSPQGTSFAAPQIAGLCALLLSANTNLTIRDVQQVLVLSARHFDFADRDLATNGAGLLVSHNLGFGVPDAGLAVRLAKVWSNRPPLVTITNSIANIPISDGPVARATGAGVPADLLSIPVRLPSEERHPDERLYRGPIPTVPTASVPLVFVGTATNTILQDLTGKAALIQRETNSVNEQSIEKLQRAQAAGAVFAIFYDLPSTNTNGLIPLTLTEAPQIPAALTYAMAGNSLAEQAQTNSELRIQVNYVTPATASFVVTNDLLCEHVGVRLQTSYSNRGDLRITLISPSGTRSVLQRFNPFTVGGSLSNWTFYSTLNFFESTAGTWAVEFADEELGSAGVVLSADLLLHGVPILDTDRDGLDDNWETAKLGSLSFGPLDDPDGDGFSNAREQAIGSQPNQMDSPFPFALDASVWNSQLVRLSWPAAAGRGYELRTNTNPAGVFAPLTNVSGRFPDGEVFVPRSSAGQFFQLRAP